MKLLDQKDRKILSLLDMNALFPRNILAKKVGVGREVVEYRIRRLKSLGIISDPHTVFDTNVLGYQSFRILLRLCHLNEEQKKDFIRAFVEHKNTWWVASVGGRWDFIMNFIAEDTATFNDIFEDIITKYGSFLQEYEVLLYINIHDYARKYFSEKKQEREEEFYHTLRYREGFSLDKTDKRIMLLLAENASLGYTEIGKHVNLTRNAVKERIRFLEKEKIILGYRTTYHPSSLGYSSYLLFLNINNLKKERERTLLEYAKRHPNIIFVVKHIGRYRIALECEIENERKFHELLVDIRDKFNDIILDFDFFPIFKDHKINYFPVSD